MQCLVNDITIRDGAVSIGSGSYHIWLEVDDGINDPVQVYLPEP